MDALRRAWSWEKLVSASISNLWSTEPSVDNKKMIEKYSLYKGKVSLEFESQKHIYSVDGKNVYGVTSITGVLDKPGLKYWAVNKAIDFLYANLVAGRSLDEVQIKNLLETARREHTASKDKAADVGTLIHKWISDYIAAVIKKETPPARPVNPEMKNAVDGFFKWAKENKVKILKSEQKVYHTKYRYAGTLDLEAMVNGKRTVIDIKTGGTLYPEAFLQAAAYLKAREQEIGIEYPGGVIVLRLSKEDKAKKVEAFEARKDENVKTHFQCFLFCLGIYRWQMAMKKQAIVDSINGK